MSKGDFDLHLEKEIFNIKKESLYKQELVITSQQQVKINTVSHQQMLNFCANNYLGLANNPQIIKAAIDATQKYGFGLASVRFICGTQVLHKELEAKLSDYIGTEDSILYSSCFDANGGLFETLFSSEDAIISDQLNHASIIDGVRLSKAKRYRYNHNDMNSLKEQLQQAKQDKARFICIVTDGVFSMDGTIADLANICDLADQYGALTMIDDCHATGFLGDNGRGTHELCGVLGRVDIITGTFGKALGGASGGYVCSSRNIVEKLRQKSRPYLFSNALAPMICAASLKALELVQAGGDLRLKLQNNTDYFRKKIQSLGFDIIAGEHPIVPIMLKDAAVAKRFSQKLIDRGIFAIDFSYPVVPHGKARIRVQLSSSHTKDQLDFALNAFAEIKQELVNIIN